jgi:hypothetical protein
MCVRGEGRRLVVVLCLDSEDARDRQTFGREPARPPTFNAQRRPRLSSVYM